MGRQQRPGLDATTKCANVRAAYVESRGLTVATEKRLLASTSHNAAHHISRKMWSSTSYDGQGFWLAQKRLSQGRFAWWPTGSGAVQTLEAHQAQLLLAAGNPASAQAAPVWRGVSAK